MAAQTAQRKVVVADHVGVGKVPDAGEFGGVGQIDIVDAVALVTEKVGVTLSVRTKPRWPTVKVDLLDQAALCERFETIINGGQRDRGHLLLHPVEHLDRARVIAGFEENLVNLAALAGQTKAARRDRFAVVQSVG